MRAQQPLVLAPYWPAADGKCAVEPCPHRMLRSREIEALRAAVGLDV